jgi:hypothetical protein
MTHIGRYGHMYPENTSGNALCQGFRPLIGGGVGVGALSAVSELVGEVFVMLVEKLPVLMVKEKREREREEQLIDMNPYINRIKIYTLRERSCREIRERERKASSQVVFLTPDAVAQVVHVGASDEDCLLDPRSIIILAAP